MNKNPPLVSVCMITFKHEEFIRQAIEGVLMQEVDFDIEFLIADDASPDSTYLIVQEYIQNHPKGSWIKYVRHPENKGPMENAVWVLENCKGKYIGLCEGDDYWIEPFKLKRQIDFLINNPDYSLVSHYSKKISFRDEKLNIFGKLDKDDYSYDDPDYHFLPLPSASICFNKSFSIPDWFFKVYGGDRALIFLCSQYGRIKILDFIGSVYRVHPSGIEQNYKSDKLSLPLRNLKELPIYYELSSGRFKKKIIGKISWNYFYLFLQYLKLLRLSNSLQSLFKSIYWKAKYYAFKNHR